MNEETEMKIVFAWLVFIPCFLWHVIVLNLESLSGREFKHRWWNFK